VIRVENLVFAYERRGIAAAPAERDTPNEPDETASRASERDDTAESTGGRTLDGISLTIPDGEFLLLAGPNGSGKSTLVKQFVGLLEPDAGSVRVDGLDPTAEPVRVRSAVGMVFQNPRDQLVASTVEADVAFGPENLGLDRPEIQRRVEEALSTVRMSDRRTERVVDLSGGERARVALAGVLAMEPSHLVLDEPFVGLDARARESVLEHVRELAAGDTTVVVVTHDLRQLLTLADRVVVLSDGRVAVDGAPADVRDRLSALGVDVPATADEGCRQPPSDQRHQSSSGGA
jgi:biotin transport system ATP-binding protein